MEDPRRNEIDLDEKQLLPYACGLRVEFVSVEDVGNPQSIRVYQNTLLIGGKE